MKRFNITVNGRAYDVQVDELGAGAPAPVAVAAPVAAAPTAAPAAAPVVSSGAAAVKVTAPMPATVLDVKVKEGQHVEKDQLLVMIEAMKMEQEIFSPAAGTVTTVHVKKGDSVNTSDLLISMN